MVDTDIESGPRIGEGGKVHEVYTKGHKTNEAALKKMNKKLRHKVVPLVAAGSLITGAATEATFHPVENAVNKANAIVEEVNADYKIGQIINSDKVYEVQLINSVDENGAIIEPKALVTIEGKTLSIPINDPNLSSFDRDSLRGLLRIDEGSYKVDDVTNPDYKNNLANGFSLPEDIGKHFNRIPGEEGLTPRAVYFEPTGVFYTVNGRDFPVRFPLIVVQPPLSTGS